MAETPLSSPVASSVAVPAFIGVRKPVPTKLTVVRAAQLKPCDKDTIPGANPDDEPIVRVLLVYVTPEGQQVIIPCHTELYSAFVNLGLDMIDDSDFLIFVDRKANVAVRVEPVKRHEYMRNIYPEHLEGVKSVTFHVDERTGYASIKEYPPKLDREIAIQMKLALDAMDSIVPGQKILDKFPITEVRSGVGGSIVTVNALVK